MLIAQKKKKENIAEYILYLFQIEDIVRSFKFDVDEIMEDSSCFPTLSTIVLLKVIENGTKRLLSKMKAAKLGEKGYRSSWKFFRIGLYTIPYIPCKRRANTKHFIENAYKYIPEYRSKSDMKNNHDIEVIIHAMYMKLQRRREGKKLLLKLRRGSMPCVFKLHFWYENTIK